MGKYSKLSNLSRGGRSVKNYNTYTGELLHQKTNYTLWIIIALVLILVGAGVVILDKKGILPLGIFPDDKKEN